jgi:hypothetical protein
VGDRLFVTESLDFIGERRSEGARSTWGWLFDIRRAHKTGVQAGEHGERITWATVVEIKDSKDETICSLHHFQPATCR